MRRQLRQVRPGRLGPPLVEDVEHDELHRAPVPALELRPGVVVPPDARGHQRAVVQPTVYHRGMVALAVPAGQPRPWWCGAPPGDRLGLAPDPPTQP